MPQRLHLLFQILKRNPQHLLAQIILQLCLCRRTVKALGVKEFIQQQRRFCQLPGDPGALTAQPDQLGTGARVLNQQHHIGGSTEDGLDQLQHPRQSFGGVIDLGERLKQHRHELIEPSSPLGLKVLYGPVVA